MRAVERRVASHCIASLQHSTAASNIFKRRRRRSNAKTKGWRNLSRVENSLFAYFSFVRACDAWCTAEAVQQGAARQGKAIGYRYGAIVRLPALLHLTTLLCCADQHAATYGMDDDESNKQQQQKEGLKCSRPVKHSLISRRHDTAAAAAATAKKKKRNFPSFNSQFYFFSLLLFLLLLL